MSKALNLKIDEEIYNKLDYFAKRHGLTKTQLVELALTQCFDSYVADVDSNVDSYNPIEYMQGVSCNLPDANYQNLYQAIVSLQHQIDDLKSGNLEAQNTAGDVDNVAGVELSVKDVADEVGLSGRTIRDNLKTMQIGEVLTRNNRTYKLTGKKPYKLVRV
jgi:antitoxin component of RelBE/YafQ-DinJ toxin-antitoxin module